MPGVARPSANLAGRQWPFQCPAFSRAGRLLAKPQPGQFGGFGAIAENPRSPNESANAMQGLFNCEDRAHGMRHVLGQPFPGLPVRNFGG